MIKKYLNHKLQTNPWYREKEPHNNHNNHETPGRQTKQSNQLSLPHRGDCKARMDTSNAQQNIEKLQNPTKGVTTFEWTAAKATGRGLKCILLVSNLHPRFRCC